MLLANDDHANFVDIIGFGLEKVHMGLLAWLLETDSNGCGAVSIEDKVALINSISGKDLEWTSIQAISTVREESPGNRVRSDLRVEARGNGINHWIVIEAKTESDVNPAQLESLEKAYRSWVSHLEEPRPELSFVLMMIGASQYTEKHAGIPGSSSWNKLNLDDIVRILQPLRDKHIYAELWHQSLVKRSEMLVSVASRWMGNMCRSDYYALYDLIRSHLVELEGNEGSHWRIINGQFNAVLYGRTFPKIPAERDALHGIFFWWDIDDDFLVLKGSASKDESVYWSNLKAIVRQAIRAMVDLPVIGEQTRNKEGTDQSLWKWRVIQGKPDPREIANQVLLLIEAVESRLKALFSISK